MFIIVALSGLFLFFQNCQRPPEDPKTEASARSSRGPASESNPGDKVFSSVLEAAAEPFSEGKLQISVPGDPRLPHSAKTLTAASAWTQALIVVVDNGCADNDPGAPLVSLLDRRLRLPLAVQAYGWTPANGTTLGKLNELANNDPCVIGISQDEEIQLSSLNDPQVSSQKNFTSIGGVDTFPFFSDPVRGSTSSVLVAVIDSGVKRNQPDLVNSLWTSSSGSVGVNFINSAATVEDDNGHGTAVSGILAAQANNGIGIAGVMGHDIKIMPLKVINASGSSTIELMSKAIQYAAAANVDVINISMEGSNPNAALRSVLQSAVTGGTVIVVAAGNGGLSINAEANAVIPALYSMGLGGMISVGSIDATSGAKSSFSNYGSNYVEIAAPGSGGVRYPNLDGGYSSGTGTSYSAPLVSGAAALVVSFFKKNNISWNPALVENVLMASALKKSSLTGSFKNGNTLDLRSLAQYLKKQYLTPVDGGFDEN